MRQKAQRPLSAAELVHAVRVYEAGQPDENFSMRRFQLDTGISQARIYRHFKSWLDVRQAAGLVRMTASRKRWSDDELLAELHRVAQTVNRFPNSNEICRHSEISLQTYYHRFGRMPLIIERYKTWLRANGGLGAATEEEPRPRHMQRSRLDPSQDVKWIRLKWQNLKMGFELRSRDFEGRRPDECDLLVVLEHDWKGCPVRVLELKDVLVPGEI